MIRVDVLHGGASTFAHKFVQQYKDHVRAVMSYIKFNKRSPSVQALHDATLGSITRIITRWYLFNISDCFICLFKQPAFLLILLIEDFPNCNTELKVLLCLKKLSQHTCLCLTNLSYTDENVVLYSNVVSKWLMCGNDLQENSVT